MIRALRIGLLLLALCIQTLADEVEQGAKDSAPSGLLAGVARADTTPPVGIAHMNWGSQSHILSTGNNPLGMCATALVLSDGNTKFAMVDIDRLFVSGLESSIARASKLTGIPAENIRLAATHTHAAVNVSAAKGPAGLDLSEYQAAVQRYNESIVDKFVGLIVQANADLQPAHIFGDRGEGRNPQGFVDRELIVFRIDDANGKPIAVLANFPCHGTVLAYENKMISPDWIGMVRRVVEDAMPTAKCLFFQGAAGKQGPIEGFTGDLGVAHRLGAMLGHGTASLAFGIETVNRVPTFEGFVESTAYQAKQHWRVKGPRGAKLSRASKVIQLPRRTYSDKEINGMAGAIG